MSGPPNINNGASGGSGRGWLRTPPPTYFRSPSPWVPPGTASALRQQPPSTTGGFEAQAFARYNASPTYLPQPTYGYESVETSETQNQRAANIRCTNGAQNETHNPNLHRVRTTPIPERHINETSSITQQTQLRNTSYSHQYSGSIPTAAKNVMLPPQRMYSATPTHQLESNFQRPQSRGLPVRYPTPSFSYQPNSDNSSSNQPQYVIYDYAGEAGPSTAEIIANQSQDYVDEKLAEYQATIHLLQGT